jgi:tagaturonate reductase
MLRGRYVVVAVQRFASEPACPGAPAPAPPAAVGTVQPSRAADLPRLSAAHWPTGVYRREDLQERVLQFGTGMLLRALCASAVDAANRRGAFGGRIVAVQNTPHGRGHELNAQGGLFTLVERGLENGAPVERMRLVGSISRALVAADDWPAVRDVVARPELQVIVSNVTEAGFRLDGGFPARCADLLYTRFERLPDGPPVFVIPTELVADNGERLRAMVGELAAHHARGREFRDWLPGHVRFCSSLVDRITTGMPAAEARTEIERRLGYSDALLTVTEPHCLWAVKAEPDALRAAFSIDAAPAVIFASDIAFYSERKLRLLNGAHTALAPLALLAGVATVREAAEHPRLGPLLHRILFDELGPGTDLPAEAAEAFAKTVVERFRNPWLDHEWRVIATNQSAKMGLRVAPSIVTFAAKWRRVPEGLALACAAHLRFLRCVAERSAVEGTGWWRGATYPVSDVGLPTIGRHWRDADPALAAGPVPADVLERVAACALADATLWGWNLAELPGFLEATTRWLLALERDGVDAALETLCGNSLSVAAGHAAP